MSEHGVSNLGVLQFDFGLLEVLSKQQSRFYSHEAALFATVLSIMSKI